MVTILFKIMQRLVKKRPKLLNNVNGGGGKFPNFFGKNFKFQLVVGKNSKK